MATGAVAIVVAGGSGERSGIPGGKQLALVAGRPVVSWALGAMAAVPEVERIVLVCDPSRTEEFRVLAVDPYSFDKPVKIVAGGESRAASVAAGLGVLSLDHGTVVVHDGARPLVRPGLVSDAIRELEESGADGVVAAHRSVDTLKVVDAGQVTRTLDRERVWAIQTPQVFRVGALRRAHALAAENGDVTATDDAGMVERAGGVIRVIEAPRDNMKVTLPEDFAIAEVLLTRREGRDS